MSFINKNANILLLFLIILSATALVGATVFFQMNFERINSEYHDKVTQLQQVSKDLSTQQDLLNQMKNDLTLKQQREDALGQKYTDVSSANSQLQGEKAQLQQTQEQLQSELDSTESSLQDTKSQLTDKTNQVTQLTSDNANLQSELSTSEQERQDLQNSLNSCTTAKAACNCSS